ncbi:MAG: glycerate kinase [Pseudomonadota bacterium]
MTSDPHTLLNDLFQAAVTAADPMTALQGKLPARPKGRTVVVGAGKGAAQLAHAFEKLWAAPCEGAVVTRYGYGKVCNNIEILEAAHPVPDAAGLKAAHRMKELVGPLGPEDLVVALICGGGSSLLPAPPDGISLADLQELNRILLASGAPISVMNDIRKCFSTINGGRLAALAAPARVCTFIVSDVPGDMPNEVASGPTVAGRPTLSAVRDLVAAYRIRLPAACQAYLDQANDEPHPDLARTETHIIGSSALSLKAAAQAADSSGIATWVLSDRIEGEAREVAKVHAAIAQQVQDSCFPLAPPCVLLSGGETTVTLRHDGRGGRNSEFQLSLALALEGTSGIHALAADTDGIDGSEDNAGAFVDSETTIRMRQAGLDPVSYLNKNDSYTAFAKLGDLFITGPTGTNVNDFRAILIEAAGKPENRQRTEKETST